MVAGLTRRVGTGRAVGLGGRKYARPRQVGGLVRVVTKNVDEGVAWLMGTGACVTRRPGTFKAQLAERHPAV